MLEQIGDIWELAKDQILVFTSNGNIRKDGKAVMGAGIAKQVADKFPGIPKILAENLRNQGNHVSCLGIYVEGDAMYCIYSFPTKHDWRDDSDLELIKQSVKELARVIEIEPFDRIYLTRPGCGNGNLKWEDVKSIVSVLDDRFIVVSSEA